MSDTSPPCPRCLLRDCMCGDIPRIANRTEVVVVRHASEDGRASNSGRLAVLALERAALLPYGRKGAPLDDSALVVPGSCILFPEAGAAPVAPPRRLIVLDASWSQARRMRQRIPALRGLPALPIAAPLSHQRCLRTPPQPGFLPTLLAIAAALESLEGDAVAAPLRQVYATLVERLTARSRFPPRFLD